MKNIESTKMSENCTTKYQNHRKIKDSLERVSTWDWNLIIFNSKNNMVLDFISKIAPPTVDGLPFPSPKKIQQQIENLSNDKNNWKSPLNQIKEYPFEQNKIFWNEIEHHIIFWFESYRIAIRFHKLFTWIFILCYLVLMVNCLHQF